MIRLVYSTELGECDLARAEDGGVDEGDELATAILISFFTDAPADETEVPDGTDRRGWWGDAYPVDEEDDVTGSKLWLLERARLLADTPIKARKYAGDALAWIITDGIARAVDVEANPNGRGRLDLLVRITLTDGTIRTYEVPGAV